DLGSGALEHLRRLHGRHPGGGYPELPAVLLLQPDHAGAGHRSRLSAASAVADCRLTGTCGPAAAPVRTSSSSSKGLIPFPFFAIKTFPFSNCFRHLHPPGKSPARPIIRIRAEFPT